MSKRNDQVFQVSLTEIAFTIVFLLLLLLGYLLFDEQKKSEELQAIIKELQTAGDTRAAADEARKALKNAVAAAGGSSTDDVITKLIEAEKAKAEEARLKAVIEDLNQRLTALTELQKKIDNVAKEKQDEVARDQVVSALAVQEVVEEQPRQPQDTRGQQSAQAKVRQAFLISQTLKASMKQRLQEDIAPGREVESVSGVVDRARQFTLLANSGSSKEALTKENVDLRGQVAFLKNRLDARGGRDYPPCWADESGKVEFLFNVDLRPDSVTVTPAWPSKRDSDARALPNIDAVMTASHSYDQFKSSIQGIFNWSKQHDPQCRHYVQLRSDIADAVQSDRARLMVEEYFYKVEARR